MALSALALRITARDEGATQTLNRVGDAGKKLGTDVKTGADKAKSELRGVGDSAARMGQEVAKSGDAGARGLNALKDGFKGVGSDAKAAESSVGGLVGSLAKIAGVNIGAAALRSVSNNLIQAGLEADTLGSKLSTMLNKNEMGAAIGDVQKLGKELSVVTGVDDDEIAKNIASAVTKGRLGGLVEYGIIVDEAGKKSIEAAKGVSELAGRQETLRQVMRAGAEAVGEMRAASSDAALGIGEFDVAFGDAQENVGIGAAAMRAKWLSNFTPILKSLGEGDASALRFAGGLLETGNMAVSALTPLYSVVEGVLAYKNATNLSKLARIAETGATGAATIATTANTAAVVANGNAAAAATLKFRALALARSPLGIAGAGILLGGAIYNATRDEGEAGAVEAAGNAWATAKNAVGIDSEFTEQDGLTRTQKLDNAIAANQERMAAKKQKKEESALMAGLQTPSMPTTGAMAMAASPLAVSPTMAPLTVAPSVTAALKAKGTKDGEKVKAATFGAWAKSLKTELDTPPSEGSGQGEANVAGMAAWAEKLFDNMTEGQARKVFNAMAARFEQPGGFEGEAQMEAAKRAYWEKFMRGVANPAPLSLTRSLASDTEETDTNPRDVAAQLAAKRLGASRDYTPGITGGSMLQIGAGNYANASGSFVNGNAEFMRAGVASAMGGIGTYGASAYVNGRRTDPSGETTVPVVGQGRPSGYSAAGKRLITFDFKSVTVEADRDDGMMSAAESIH